MHNISLESYDQPIFSHFRQKSMLGSDLSMEDGLIFRNNDLFEDSYNESTLTRPRDVSQSP